MSDLTVATYIATGLGTPPGFGALVDDINAAAKIMDPVTLVKKFWDQIQGRSWDQAVASARSRAASGSWSRNDTASVNDLIVLIVSSAIDARQTKDGAAKNALNQTWIAFVQRMGIDPTQLSTPDQIQQKAGAQGNVLLIVGALIGLLIQVAVIASVYMVAIYYAAQLVNNYLAISECDKELARLQSAVDQITEQHTQDGKPWTQDEKDLRDKLLSMQQQVAGGCTTPTKLSVPPGFRQPGEPPFDPWPYVIGGTLVAGGVAGFVYRKEIGAWFARRRARA